MQLQKHRVQLTIPDVAQIVHILVNFINGVHHAMIAVTPTEMTKLHQKGSRDGIPVYYCHEGNKITFYPRPDADYDITIRYLPPEKEL